MIYWEREINEQQYEYDFQFQTDTAVIYGHDW